MSISKTKILAIVPYQEMKTAMERLAAERSDIALTVRIGNIGTAAAVFKEYSDTLFDVIISRGGTANLLRSLSIIPVVEITVSIYDILRSLKSAQNFTGKFAVVGYKNITECVQQLSAMMQYDVRVCTISDRKNIKKELLALRAQGVELVLCDRISKINAEELGMNALFLTSDDASISAAFNEAVHIASLCRNFKRQNMIMYNALLTQEFHTLVFDDKGSLLFSTLKDDGLWKGFSQKVQDQLPLFLHRDTLEREYEHNGYFLFIRSSWITCCGQSCLCLRIKISEQPLLAPDSGIALSDTMEQLADEVSQTGSVVYMGEISRAITACFSCMYPILIMGERGTGKDTVASIIYRNGPCRRKKLMTIDCSNISKRQFQMLLNPENSPFMNNGITIYFRSLNCLSEAQATALYSSMEQTKLPQRNRLIFSFLPGQEQSENGYVCSYLKDHFSTIALRLPPLRYRKNDIPNIVTIYIHQLNSQLSKRIIGLEREGLALLQEFSWEGNLSQLSRIIRTLILRTDSAYINTELVREVLKEELPFQPAELPAGHALLDLRQPLREITKNIVQLVMNEEQNNQSRTAKRLKICRTTIWNLLRHPN